MIPQEIYNLKVLLESFLGESKRELSESYQLQFSCPRCVEYKGEQERHKFNLEVNLKHGVFNCWSCGQFDNDMHGSIKKLIMLYGSPQILKEYNENIKALKNSKLYQISFDDGDFSLGGESQDEHKLQLPSNYMPLYPNGTITDSRPIEYLTNRGITWDIIAKYRIGYTYYDVNNKLVSNRIIIPSFDEFDELTYWTGRDFTKNKRAQKYFNPIVERKSLIFNERHVDWDADITLVEGPFDHIVVPNSIPLLGKSLSTDFKLYGALVNKSNAHINIFLDADAVANVKTIYKLLNHDKLYGKIRYIPVSNDLDPSSIFETMGRKGIIAHLKNASKINEIYL